MPETKDSTFVETPPTAEPQNTAVKLSGTDTAGETQTQWVGVVIKGAFLSDVRTNSETGKQFYDVSVPEGTKLGGAIDVGGYTFTVNASQVHLYDYDENAVKLGFPEDWDIRLDKRELQDDGSYKTVDTKTAKPAHLKSAFTKQYQQFKKAKEAERAAKQTDGQKTVSPAKDQAQAERSADARSKSAKQPDRRLTK